MRYIAFLRGINVGGHQVKMEVLRALFVELGFEKVRTYIQTGNIFFETKKTPEKALEKRIETHLLKALGYEVPVFLRTVDEVEKVLALDPFKRLKVTPDMRLCLVFLTESAPKKLALPLRSPKGDLELYRVTNREAFVIWYLINGRPPSSTTFLDKLIGRRTTTRFYHTAQKILEAAKEMK